MPHEQYPSWIYPGGDVSQGFVVKDEAEHRAKCPEDFPEEKASEAPAAPAKKAK